MSMQVNVLCPDGHRVTVKVTKQTPLLTILEEACTKRKLDPTQHALRKENDRPHVPNLDCSLTMKFAGLANHCKLEAVPCKNTSSASQKVKIALQLPEGGRVIDEYSSEDTLDKIFESGLDRYRSNNGIPIDTVNGIEKEKAWSIVYMEKTIEKESFSETTLKKLGLTSGSAVLRLNHRAAENLEVDQAGVFNMAGNKPEGSTEEKKWRPMRKEGDEATLKLFDNFRKQENSTSSEMSTGSKDETMEVDSTPDDIIDNSTKIENDNIEIAKAIEESKKEIGDKILSDVPKELPILHYLDEDHQTVIYKLTDRSAKIRNVIDVSDDFFELTIVDAQKLLRDVRKQQKDDNPEEKALMTKAMRETQKEGKKLALLNKYKKSVVRVQLPDRHIIQAVFSPGADLIQVMDNLKKYLNIQENLELFTTPPKCVLDLNQNLLDCDLVPAALIYLSSKNSSNSASNSMISEEFLEKLSNTSGAEFALSDSGVMNCAEKSGNLNEIEHLVPHQNVANSSNGSEGSGSNAAATKRPPTTSLTGKVPKWLKCSKQ